MRAGYGVVTLLLYRGVVGVKKTDTADEVRIHIRSSKGGSTKGGYYSKSKYLQKLEATPSSFEKWK